MHFKNTVLILLIPLISCGKLNSSNATIAPTAEENERRVEKSIPVEIVTGASQTAAYTPLLQSKKVGIVSNQTSVVFNEKEEAIHLVDTLLKLKVQVTKVFAPEHGFRGTADAGALVKDGMDVETGLPIYSLYGKNKKPTPAMFKDIEIVVFDIQDVGARFYTYISTLHYVMEACAENNIPLLLLDRPNPNGHYVDGPVLEAVHKSFVGMHPVPVVHGMTIGEYAKMINGEKWLNNGVQCELNIIQLKGYDHQKAYSLPIKPSPNLPNDRAINLYPSLCFFEGTNVSVGRGTDSQFQVFGAPHFPQNNFYFTPHPNNGAQNPKFNGKKCYGRNLVDFPTEKMLNFTYLIEAYSLTKEKSSFFKPFFTKLAGTKKLQEQLEQGVPIAEIRKSWQKELEAFQKMRINYLLYP